MLEQVFHFLFFIFEWQHDSNLQPCDCNTENLPTVLQAPVRTVPYGSYGI